MEIKDLTSAAQAAAAIIATVVGSYTLGDKFGLFDKRILEWAPEHFKIEAVSHKDPILVTVARIKKRDDCSVESFTVAVKDSRGMMHDAKPSMSKFSGPATPRIDTFTYEMKITSKEHFTPGIATLLATIKYKCPEGEKIVQYPDHKNLTFNIPK